MINPNILFVLFLAAILLYVALIPSGLNMFIIGIALMLVAIAMVSRLIPTTGSSNFGSGTDVWN
jgi:hypothetical protein